MIKKIQGSEYLKRYDNMMAQERKAYEIRVGQWSADCWPLLSDKVEVFEASMQNVLQMSVTWNDQECQAFEEGARLLSALVGTSDTWLPEMLYAKSAKRAIKRMFTLLWGVDEGHAETTTEKTTEQEPGQRLAKDSVRMQAGTAKEAPIQPDAPFQDNAGNGNITGGNQNGETQVDTVPARPKHIDQYVHLLPKKTQEHAALVQGLYRELDDARQKMDLLMNDPKASPRDREAWAKKATKCDNALRRILDELDAEWAKLVKEGRVVVDDLGNARVIPADKPADESTGTVADGANGANEANEANGTQELTSEQKARRRDLRKWLTDTRRGNGAAREERVKKWKENFKEYLTLEGDAAFKDEKILEAMKHYGISPATTFPSREGANDANEK